MKAITVGIDRDNGWTLPQGVSRKGSIIACLSPAMLWAGNEAQRVCEWVTSHPPLLKGTRENVLTPPLRREVSFAMV